MSLFNPAYPNLELLEYKAKEILDKDDFFNQKVNEHKNTEKYKRYQLLNIEFDAEVFSQIWGSTCTGFDCLEDGTATIGGDAMTKEYTTVIQEKLTGIYLVFFGSNFCYKIHNPNKVFFEDLKNHNMASRSRSKKYEEVN